MMRCGRACKPSDSGIPGVCLGTAWARALYHVSNIDVSLQNVLLSSIPFAWAHVWTSFLNYSLWPLLVWPHPPWVPGKLQFDNSDSSGRAQAGRAACTAW